MDGARGVTFDPMASYTPVRTLDGGSSHSVLRKGRPYVDRVSLSRWTRTMRWECSRCPITLTGELGSPIFFSKQNIRVPLTRHRVVTPSLLRSTQQTHLGGGRQQRPPAFALQNPNRMSGPRNERPMPPWFCGFRRRSKVRFSLDRRARTGITPIFFCHRFVFRDKLRRPNQINRILGGVRIASSRSSPVRFDWEH